MQRWMPTFAALSMILSLCSPGQAQDRCDQLKSLALPNAEITRVQSVPAGPYKPVRAKVIQLPVMLPAHCRVAALLKPSSDSQVEVEVWLPLSDWNGKFQAVGNGGWAGSITYDYMALALLDHYSTASTDTGHKGVGLDPSSVMNDASFALGHPEKFIDFAYRAVHEMTVKSKSIITAFYRRGPNFSYWNGCSTGGRQGLMEAQRYPEDYDGIIAGAPATSQSHLSGWHLQMSVENLNSPERLIPPKKYALLHGAVLAACDVQDGIKDGILNDPRTCKFDPSKLLCKAVDSDSCLTAAQVESAKAIYGSVKTKDGSLFYPGLEPGTELDWQFIAGGPEPFTLALNGYKYFAHSDPNWDWRTFNIDRDLVLMKEKAGSMDAVSADLQAFKAHGGKLLLYHGWSDQFLPPENTVNYYSSVLAKMGPGQNNWLRLFMEPGMQHCVGGPGPNQFNAVAAMERWREAGIAPDVIAAAHVTGNRVDMTRPLCPYPQVAKWNGVGSTNDAKNFVCKKP